MKIDNEIKYFIDNYGCELIIRGGLIKYHLYLRYKSHEYYLKIESYENILREICRKERINFKQELEEFRNATR